jgi:hypothetical protein
MILQNHVHSSALTITQSGAGSRWAAPQARLWQGRGLRPPISSTIPLGLITEISSPTEPQINVQLCCCKTMLARKLYTNIIILHNIQITSLQTGTLAKKTWPSPQNLARIRAEIAIR